MTVVSESGLYALVLRCRLITSAMAASTALKPEGRRARACAAAKRMHLAHVQGSSSPMCQPFERA
jgi:hypothetical protein